MFAKYAAIVKNLRGVVLFDLDEEGSWSSVKWLINRFKYRDLGLVPSTYHKYSSKLKGHVEGNPFRVLAYPLQELELFAREFSQCIDVEPELGELLVLSSLYISPAMVMGTRYSNALSKLCVEVIKTCKELSTEDWKLHMRIADYTILDMYEFSISTALKAVETCSRDALGQVLGERMEAIKKDVKRYWRILCNEGGEKVFLCYIDNLKLYTESCGLQKLCGRSNTAVALAIVPVIRIPTGLS
jgi:hypothetical protein